MRRHLRSSSRIPESAIADKWGQTTLLFLSAPWSSSGPTASTLTNCDFTCPATSSPVGAARKRLRAPPHNDPCWALQPLRQQVNCCSLSSNRASQRDPHSPESYGFLHVATITAVHGVHGAVKATSTSDFAAHRLSPTTESKYILLPGRLYPRPVTVTSSRPSSRANTWIVGLSCVESREDFGKMKLQGARLYVKAQDKPPLARGEFVAADLIDLNVCLLVTEENQDELQVGYTTSTRNRGDIKGSKSIAVVEEIIPSQAVSASKLANDVLQIAFFNNNNSSNDGSNYIDENSKRVLIPFVKQIVPIVDLSAGLIVIDPPEGLLDVAIVNQVKKPIKPRGYLMPAANV